MDANSIQIMAAAEEHAQSILTIYQQGIDTGIATFETAAPDWPTWQKKYRADAQFVACINNTVAGWVTLSQVSARAVYCGVCETSLYISPLFQRRGIGLYLLKHIITESEQLGIWTLQANIFPQNAASILLHQRSGFQIVGSRERIAQRHGQWYDNVLLERRSELF